MKMKFAFFMMIIFIASPCKAIEIWHQDTVWAGRGMCVYNFGIDGQDMLFETSGGGIILDLGIRALDENAVLLDDISVNTELFATCEADRFTNIIFESDCSTEFFQIESANVLINGVKTDLLQSKQLRIRDWKPVPIVFDIESAVGSTVDPQAQYYIDYVRNGRFQFDDSITIAQAFEGYAFFDNYSWVYYVNEQGRTIVEFKSNYSIVDYFEEATDRAPNYQEQLALQNVMVGLSIRGITNDNSYISIVFSVNTNSDLFNILQSEYILNDIHLVNSTSDTNTLLETIYGYSY